MRALIAGAAAVLGIALSGPALGVDPVKPEIGPGPNLDRSGRTSGAGESPRQPDASTGPSTPEDARIELERKDDERKATESKEKMKKRPGFKEEAPSPRASLI
jgi:hypothetical protein